jgi:hypothetical protein
MFPERNGNGTAFNDVPIRLQKYHGDNEADFETWRRDRASTAWKYAMWDAGCRLPTQMADDRSRCFCGAEITIADVDEHIYVAHIDPKAA